MCVCVCVCVCVSIISFGLFTFKLTILKLSIYLHSLFCQTNLMVTINIGPHLELSLQNHSLVRVCSIRRYMIDVPLQHVEIIRAGLQFQLR